MPKLKNQPMYLATGADSWLRNRLQCPLPVVQLKVWKVFSPMVEIDFVYGGNTAQAGGSSLSDICDCLLNIFAATNHIWRSEDTPRSAVVTKFTNTVINTVRESSLQWDKGFMLYKELHYNIYIDNTLIWCHYETFETQRLISRSLACVEWRKNGFWWAKVIGSVPL